MLAIAIDPAWTREILDDEAHAGAGAFAWVYDRLLVARTQPYGSGDRETPPQEYAPEIVVKPRMNLDGMSRGVRPLRGPLALKADEIWCEMLAGRHVSIDALLVEGKLAWTANAVGFLSTTFGRFEMWALLAEDLLPERHRLVDFIVTHLADYSGPMNVEMIGARIIEVHLRLSRDWQRAGCYGRYDGAPSAAIGIPLWRAHPPWTLDLIPSFAHIDREIDADRRGFVVIKKP